MYVYIASVAKVFIAGLYSCLGQINVAAAVGAVVAWNVHKNDLKLHRI